MIKKGNYQINIFTRLDRLIPKFIISILSIIYLYVFQSCKIRGFGEIHAFQISNGQIKNSITGKTSTIGKNVTINAKLELEKDVYIDDECRIIIGPVFIGQGTNLMFASQIVGQVSIGKHCAIAREAIFQAQNHYPFRASIQRSFYSEILNDELPSIEKGGIQVGNDVWIGTNVIILPGVKIGDGAIIGAGSIVTKDVLPYSVVAGIPATHKKYRFPENIRKQLLDIKWWNWDENKIKRNKKFFMADLTKEDNLYDLIVD